MKFLQESLPNGLNVVAEQNPDALSMAAGYFARTGARDESPEVSGVSHFLEHMAFKGTGRRSADDVNREFDEIGAQYNAFTSEENTVYYGAVRVKPEDAGALQARIFQQFPTVTVINAADVLEIIQGVVDRVAGICGVT